MDDKGSKDGAHGNGLGNIPIFPTSITTILGTVVSLRFGFAVGNVCILGALLIIMIGHNITIPARTAGSEIAKNPADGPGRG